MHIKKKKTSNHISIAAETIRRVKFRKFFFLFFLSFLFFIQLIYVQLMNTRTVVKILNSSKKKILKLPLP